MAELSITTQGIPALIAKLGNAAAAQTLERAMTRGLALVKATLQKYPPPPAKSAYVRTGDLGRSWTSTKSLFSGDQLIGGLGNAAVSRRGGQPYAQWVQGAETQTAQHADTGWVTDQQALDQNRSAIEGAFAQAITTALDA